MGRTTHIARRCACACTPEPMMATVEASSRASARVATPDTAAVRVLVMAVPSSMAATPPCSLSKISTAPWCESNSVPWLPGKTVTSLAPNTPSPSTSTKPGMAAKKFSVLGIRITVRSGSAASPRARDASAEAITSTQASIGRRRSISDCEMTSIRLWEGDDLLFRHKRILIIQRWREGLLDRTCADPATQVELRPRLVVRARRPRATERLLAHDRTGRLVVHVEVAGRVAQAHHGFANRRAVVGEHRARERVRRCGVDRLERLAPLPVVVDVRRHDGTEDLLAQQAVPRVLRLD